MQVAVILLIVLLWSKICFDVGANAGYRDGYSDGIRVASNKIKGELEKISSKKKQN